jgi:Xaa-Pro aminopeptidase
MSAPAEKLNSVPDAAPRISPEPVPDHWAEPVPDRRAEPVPDRRAEPIPDRRAEPVPDRRADIDEKQLWIAELLRETESDGLLILDPENFAWLTSGGAARGILDPSELPALFFGPAQRCIVSSNVDSQRIFDEEADGLGFQLKEWPWQWGREQLLADLCQSRRVICDQPFRDAKVVAEQMRQRRRMLSVYERACYRSLGQIVSHALEAACRHVTPGQTEREVAGQLGHRLFHRGAYPVAISLSADGRSRLYRQGGFTAAPIHRYCIISTTVRKYGLHVTASRSVSLGPLDGRLRQENEAVCKINATYVGATWADAVPSAILSAGRRVYEVTGFEHEWRLCTQGFVTGRAPVELTLTPQTSDLLRVGWAISWHASAGAAYSCDTFLVTEKGPEVITPTEAWPLKRVHFHGADILLPAPLER